MGLRICKKQNCDRPLCKHIKKHRATFSCDTAHAGCPVCAQVKTVLCFNGEEYELKPAKKVHHVTPAVRNKKKVK